MVDVDPQDLTARARIRDAAMRHFADQGFDRATIRGIAAEAAVSSGLLRHHFGSKEALRDACDAHLAKILEELDQRARDGEGVNHVAAAVAALGPHQRYLARALAEGRAQAVFDRMVELGLPWLEAADAERADPPTVPLRARAAVGTAMSLSIGMLHKQLSHTLGVDVFGPEGTRLLAEVLLDIYSHPLLSPAEAARYRAGLGNVPRPGEDRS